MRIITYLFCLILSCYACQQDNKQIPTNHLLLKKIIGEEYENSIVKEIIWPIDSINSAKKINVKSNIQTQNFMDASLGNFKFELPISKQFIHTIYVADPCYTVTIDYKNDQSSKIATLVSWCEPDTHNKTVELKIITTTIPQVIIIHLDL